MAKNHGPSIKDDSRYEALRDEGYSKAKSARIANSDPHKTGHKGGKAQQYENMTKDELYGRAQDLDIEGRGDMSKDELIKHLRDKR